MMWEISLRDIMLLLAMIVIGGSFALVRYAIKFKILETLFEKFFKK